MELNQLTGNSPATLPVAATAPDAPKSVSLAAFRDVVKTRERPDKSQLKVFNHPLLGGTLLIGAMPHAGYYAVEHVEQYAPPGSAIAGQKISDSKTDDLNRDLAYLMHAVYLEGPEKLERFTREDALALLQMDGAGPSNRALLSAIKELNPPREQLNQQQAAMWAMNTATSIVLRVLLELGLGKVILDYLAPSSTEEERAAAAIQVQKVEELVLDFGPIFDTLAIAGKLGFTLGQSTAAPIEGAPS